MIKTNEECMKGCNESPQDKEATYVPVVQLVTFNGPVLHLVKGGEERRENKSSFDVASILLGLQLLHCSGMLKKFDVLYQPTAAASHMKDRKIAMTRFREKSFTLPTLRTMEHSGEVLLWPVWFHPRQVPRLL